MGYSIDTAGRILLPAATESQVLTVLEVRMAAESGPFEADRPAESLDDLARFVGARLQRHADWVNVVTDAEGDPQWTAQATAFYRGLGGWVAEGEVRFKGQDGRAWSYVYSPEGVRQVGVNGWDDSAADPPPPTRAAADLAPGSPEARAAAFAEPPPMSRGRQTAMAVLLIGGVLLIIFVALLVSGVV